MTISSTYSEYIGTCIKKQLLWQSLSTLSSMIHPIRRKNKGPTHLHTQHIQYDLTLHNTATCRRLSGVQNTDRYLKKNMDYYYYYYYFYMNDDDHHQFQLLVLFLVLHRLLHIRIYHPHSCFISSAFHQSHLFESQTSILSDTDNNNNNNSHQPSTNISSTFRCNQENTTIQLQQQQEADAIVSEIRN